MIKVIASSERAMYRNDEMDNEFRLHRDSAEVGEVFTFDGLEWTITEVLGVIE